VFPLVTLSFIVTFTACFMATTVFHNPSLNNVAATLLGGGLMFVVCRSTLVVSGFASGSFLNLRALRTRTAIALALSSAAVSVALYAMWAGQGYP
jgi:hypothetical protein